MSKLPRLTFKYVNKAVTKGQTSSRQESIAEVVRYQIMGEFRLNFTCMLQLQNWQNGETDLTCIEASGSKILNTTIGRMRLSLYPMDEDKKYHCAFKMAQLKTITPPHANFKQIDMDSYNSEMEFNLKEFLSQYGKIDGGSREEMFNDQGRKRKLIAIVFKADEIELALAIFVASRIFPLLVYGE